MRIGIDARLWNQTGVGRYIRNLVVEFDRIDKKNNYVLFVAKKDEQEIKNKLKNGKWKFVISDSRWHSFAEQLKFPRMISKEKIDLMHFPYFSVPLFYNKPYVVTIHDLILHHFPSGEASTLPLWLYGFKMLMYRAVINNAAKKSKKIIAVSSSTKKEITDNLRVSPEKVEVIYEAADDFISSGKTKMELKDYLLFVGNVYPHKNAEILINAFEFLLQKNKNLKIVFVGKDDFFYQRLRKSVKQLEKTGKVIFMFNADDKMLKAMYENAICLVRPSLMEGFSLPPLEALGSSCLVLASDIPVHREIFADSLIYFDQYKANDLVDKINYVLKMDEKSKDEKRKKGLIFARKFSWNSTARQTLNLYENSLGL